MNKVVQAGRIRIPGRPVSEAHVMPEEETAMQRKPRHLVSLLIFVALLSVIGPAVVPAAAGECTFGRPYYMTDNSTAYLPCVILPVESGENTCYYAELTIGNEGRISLETLVDTGVVPGQDDLQYASFFYQDWIDDSDPNLIGVLSLTELLIGGPDGMDGGPYNIELKTYRDDEGEIYFIIDTILPSTLTSICELTTGSHAAIDIYIMGIQYCYEVEGEQEYVDAWKNHFMAMQESATDEYMVVLFADYCEPGVYSCLMDVESGSATGINTLMGFVYDESSREALAMTCMAGGDPLVPVLGFDTSFWDNFVLPGLEPN